MKTVGIIRETKSKYERRAPLTPDDMAELTKNNDVKFIIQPDSKRIFKERDYQSAGAEINNDLSACDLVLGIKEVKIEDLIAEKTFMFFSHTIKGQEYNMPMLQKIMDLKMNLIDYEKIEDENGRRLIYFSYQAGLSGIIDTLWAFGRRIKSKGIDNPFSSLKQTLDYSSLKEAEKDFDKIADQIVSKGFPQQLSPFVVGIAGYGNVSRGVQYILDKLPYRDITPQELLDLEKSGSYSNKFVYKVVFKEEHIVEPLSKDNEFDLLHYYQNPQYYQSQFEKYIPFLSVLVNAIFWDTPYPRLVTKRFLKEETPSKLHVIGDISCDIEGAVECTLKPTDPGDPVYIYNPANEKITSGFSEEGIAMMTVDILPSELPLESSVYFSSVLKDLLPGLLSADIDKADIPAELKKALIVHKGKLTPDFTYISEYF